MTMSDPLGDMLTRIRNGQRARQAVVAAPASKIRANVLEVLKREGYIRGFTREQVRPGIAELKIELKYVDGEPVIREISRVSKPGRRIYSKHRPTCRGSITGSASRSCRPRAGSCPTTRPAPPMSAARSCAACSEPGLGSDVA